MATWWNTKENKVYISKSIQEGSIQSPIHWLIHHLIACKINMCKDDEKVTNLYVFYLWSIITTNTFYNLPYCMAKYLSEGSVKERKTSKINGGRFVTRFARSYGGMERGAGNDLTMVPSPPFNVILLKRARIFEDFGGGTFSIPQDDEEALP